MNEVIPGLWVGDLASATSAEYLDLAGITHVVNATKFQVPYPSSLPSGRAAPKVYQVPVDDSEQEPILLYFGQVNQLTTSVLTQDDPGRVLLHCQAGVSRSVTLAVAYLMTTRKLNAPAALEEIRRRRVHAEPNEGFQRQLALYYQGNYTLDVRQKEIRRFLMSTVNVMAGDSVEDIFAVSGGAVDDGAGTAPQLDLHPSHEFSPEVVTNPRTGEQINLSVSPTLKLDLNALPVTDPEDQPSQVTVFSAFPPKASTDQPVSQPSQTSQPVPPPQDIGPVLRCKKCRRLLAMINEHVIDHEPGEYQGAFDVSSRVIPGSKEASASARRPAPGATPSGHAGSAAALSASLPPQLAALRLGQARAAPGPGLGARAPPVRRMPTFLSPQDVLPTLGCGAFFVEPLKWMTDELTQGELKGRLDCPNAKCGAKLGSYDWAGSQCGCGSWITPAFALHVSKVDIQA